MTEPSEWLAERRQIAEAATEGEWSYLAWSTYALPSGEYEDSIILCNGSPDGEITRGPSDNDCAAIVDAHNTQGRLLDALEAVLELHREVEIEPSDTICAECSNSFRPGFYMPTVEWPCPTVEVIREVTER